MVDAFLALEATFRNIALAYADFDEERALLAGGHRCVDPFGRGIERVLVVDDNEISLEIMKNQLASLGAAVDTAIGGRQALWKHQAARYDLILTDIEMPEMTGFGLAKAIRRRERSSGRRTPILAITAADFQLTIEEATASGFDGHLLKPLDVEILKARLHTLRRRSSES